MWSGKVCKLILCARLTDQGRPQHKVQASPASGGESPEMIVSSADAWGVGEAREVILQTSPRLKWTHWRLHDFR